MCMMCEEEFMYQAYLNYLAGKAAQGGLTDEEKAFLEAAGISLDPAPQASNFSCDPVPGSDATESGSPSSGMRNKAS